MKFEYDEIEDKGECVAYIDIDDDLILNSVSGKALLVSSFGITMCEWNFRPDTAKHKFYRGDKLKITF